MGIGFFFSGTVLASTSTLVFQAPSLNGEEEREGCVLPAGSIICLHLSSLSFKLFAMSYDSGKCIYAWAVLKRQLYEGVVILLLLCIYISS